RRWWFRHARQRSRPCLEHRNRRGQQPGDPDGPGADLLLLPLTLWRDHEILHLPPAHWRHGRWPVAVLSPSGRLGQACRQGKAKQWAETSLKAWMADPVVLEAVRAQNAKHASIGQADIEALDKQWRAE